MAICAAHCFNLCIVIHETSQCGSGLAVLAGYICLGWVQQCNGIKHRDGGPQHIEQEAHGRIPGEDDADTAAWLKLIARLVPVEVWCVLT